MKHYLLLGACLFSTLSGSVHAQGAVTRFTNNPEFEDMQISPRGTYLAFTQIENDREYLLVVKTENLEGISKTGFGSDVDVSDFDWVTDERLTISPGRSFLGRIDFKQPTGEIFAMDADSSNFENLFGYMAGNSSSSGRIRIRENIEAAGRIVDLLPDEPNEVIVQSIGYGVAGEINESWYMDIRRGRLREIKKSPLPNGVFVTDANHEVRYVYGVNRNNRGETYMLDENNNWQLVASEEAGDTMLEPIAPYQDDGLMLVNTIDENSTTGVSVWNPETGEVNSLFHHPVVDIGATYFDNDRNLWAVRYIDHLPDYFYPDESHPLAVLHKQLRQTLPGVDVQIIDETDDMDRMVVYVQSPQHAGTYLVYDTSENNFVLRLDRYPDISSEMLGRMDPIEINVRDGETIRGYITVPPGSSGKDLPLIVLPHGGPHGIYDTWTYNFETQLLANRGYAVLQVNFRGSGGRGNEFLESGYGEWGGEMQDDITDATLWAIADGVADPDRICIYGASYGAYAALTGAYREPDLYRCAIGMSGVYDLELMFESGDIADAQRGISYLKEVLGEEEEDLQSRSPVFNADNISANVMLIHGRQDVRAPLKHARRMRSALEDAGKEVVWLVESGERHGIMSDQNRASTYQAMLDFLQENIGR